MPKPQLKNIEEHLQFLIGQRNPFTKQDHLGKTSPPAVMRTDTLETLGIEFIRENVEAATETLKALLQKK
jgi:hypothetical protein